MYLIFCLIFRKEGVTGTVLAAGQANFHKDTCYIMQDDQLSPHFTVQEIMNIAADCKLGSSLSKQCKELVVSFICFADALMQPARHDSYACCLPQAETLVLRLGNTHNSCVVWAASL